MEDNYLKQHLGDVLVEGLKETALEDPADPIDYLAKWLLHYRDVEDQWAQFREDQKKLALEKAEYMANLEAEYNRLEEEKKAQEEEEKRLAEERKRLEQEMANANIEEEEQAEEGEAPPQNTNEEIDTSNVYSEMSDTF